MWRRQFHVFCTDGDVMEADVTRRAGGEQGCFLDLHGDAAGAGGADNGVLACDALLGTVDDEVATAALDLLCGLLDVVNVEADVVHALAAFLKLFGQRAVICRGLQQQ